MTKINFQIITDTCHTPVERIKEGIFITIIIRINPFLFQLSPERLRNIQMRGIKKQALRQETSMHPYCF